MIHIAPPAVACWDVALCRGPRLVSVVTRASAWSVAWLSDTVPYGTDVVLLPSVRPASMLAWRGGFVRIGQRWADSAIRCRQSASTSVVQVMQSRLPAPRRASSRPVLSQ